jgi:hypothetical protein
MSTKVHYSVQNSQRLRRILSHLNRVHSSAVHLIPALILSSHLNLGPINDLSIQDLKLKSSMQLSSLSMRINHFIFVRYVRKNYNQ